MLTEYNPEPEHSRGKLYVIGHKNPDTDSICAAIGNAAFLRMHGHPEATAARCGELTQRTEWVLQRAGLPRPEMIHDATPTAGSICTSEIDSVPPHATFMTTYQKMMERNLSTIPVIDSENHLHGLLRYFDLLNLLLPKDLEKEANVRSVRATLKNVAETIKAECLNNETLDDHDEDFILLVGASSEPSIKARLDRYKNRGEAQRLCVICGDRPEIQSHACEAGVRVLVITAGTHPSTDILELAESNGTCILVTKWDTSTVGQLIRCSRCVKEIVNASSIITFPSDLPLDQMRQLAVKSRQTLFPVLDRQSGTKIVGVVTKTDLVDPPRMRLALVDHNEFSQAVDGVEEAEIVEVMDHHRLGSQVVTRDPIRFLNEPVGSTSTLVARRFFHRDEEPEASIAICLCAGILSDTLNLTSPTTTDVDRRMLEWLCGIAKIDAKQFTDEFFSTGSLLRSGMSADEIIQSDRKEFVEFGSRISLSQIEETGMFGFDDVRPKLQKALEDLCLREGYRVAALMLTDIVNHNSLVLAVGDRHVLDSLEFERKDDNLFKAEGIVSRKKQLFPAFSLALKSVE